MLFCNGGDPVSWISIRISEVGSLPSRTSECPTGACKSVFFRSESLIRVRTWVGGDKDGHPGINEHVMIKVMTFARKRLLQITHDKLKTVEKDLNSLFQHHSHLLDGISQCLRALKSLSNLNSEDGLNLKQFRQKHIEFYIIRHIFSKVFHVL